RTVTMALPPVLGSPSRESARTFVCGTFGARVMILVVDLEIPEAMDATTVSWVLLSLTLICKASGWLMSNTDPAAGLRISTIGSAASATSMSNTASSELTPSESVAWAWMWIDGPPGAVAGTVNVRFVVNAEVNWRTNGAAPTPTTMTLVTPTSSDALTGKVKVSPVPTGSLVTKDNSTVGG